MGIQPVRIRLEPGGRVLEIPVSPDATVSDLQNLLKQYGINNPTVMAKRVNKNETPTVVPSDVRIRDIPPNAELVVSTDIDVGAW